VPSPEPLASLLAMAGEQEAAAMDPMLAAMLMEQRQGRQLLQPQQGAPPAALDALAGFLDGSGIRVRMQVGCMQCGAHAVWGTCSVGRMQCGVFYAQVLLI
jgi:hypothetical protein